MPRLLLPADAHPLKTSRLHPALTLETSLDELPNVSGFQGYIDRWEANPLNEKRLLAVLHCFRPQRQALNHLEQLWIWSKVYHCAQVYSPVIVPPNLG